MNTHQTVRRAQNIQAFDQHTVTDPGPGTRHTRIHIPDLSPAM